MNIKITPHQGKRKTYPISDYDVLAIRRWENDGSKTESSIGWEGLTDSQKFDAETAMAWKCHDVHSYEILEC